MRLKRIALLTVLCWFEMTLVQQLILNPWGEWARQAYLHLWVWWFNL